MNVEPETGSTVTGGSKLKVHDLEPATETFQADVPQGLSRQPKTVPCKYLYDERGSELFDQICDLDAYYPTRTEKAILEKYIKEIADCLGPGCPVLEPGSGTAVEARYLLTHMEEPAAFVPTEISKEFLVASVEQLDATI